MLSTVVRWSANCEPSLVLILGRLQLIRHHYPETVLTQGTQQTKQQDACIIYTRLVHRLACLSMHSCITWQRLKYVLTYTGVSCTFVSPSEMRKWLKMRTGRRRRRRRKSTIELILQYRRRLWRMELRWTLRRPSQGFSTQSLECLTYSRCHVVLFIKEKKMQSLRLQTVLPIILFTIAQHGTITSPLCLCSPHCVEPHGGSVWTFWGRHGKLKDPP